MHAGETGKFDAYVPTIVLDWLEQTPGALVRREEGTVVFVDLSGFTRLSERLARQGREGAEQLVDTISGCFSTLLAEADENGASLLKFGGDALLLWFAGEEHALRGCASAVAMRRILRVIGRIDLGGATVTLRMSVGVHSGPYEQFLVGGSHREHILAGPGVSAVVAMEAAARPGQIVLSEHTARLLPERCVGAPSAPGVLLARAPSARDRSAPDSRARPSGEAVAHCLSTALRAHLEAAPAVPEHRTAATAFLQFGGIDGLILGRGPEAAADAVDELARVAQDAADRFEVCFLGSDIAADGGKFLFSAGAPRALGDDEERMLLAMRQVVEAGTRLPVRVGVNRGHVFAGEVGPSVRRTYAVMGDVTNLAARLTARAPWGAIYTTEGVLRRSRGRFAATAAPPFAVKGKLRPVQAWQVGPALRADPAQPSRRRLPLIGRDRELSLLRTTIGRAREGRGALVELVGETGSGKSRLLAEACEDAPDLRTIHVICEAYTQAVPYIAWREPLRQIIGASWKTADAVVLERLRAHLEKIEPELLPWLPLLAIALGTEAPATRAVEELAPEFRTGKLHEVVMRFIAPALTVPTLVVIEHVHLMDTASASLLDALADRLDRASWTVMVTRREVDGGFAAPASAVQISLAALSQPEMLALAHATSEAELLPPHLLDLAVERAAGSPEFLLDLLAAAAGGSLELPDSVEAAAATRIDALDPSDRALVRRAAVLGLAFRPAHLRHVLNAEMAAPDEDTWRRLSSLFVTDPGGSVRFRRPALCDVAYEGLPFRLRRDLHAAVGSALEHDTTDGEAEPAVLSLHFSRADDHTRAWSYALIAARRATAGFANADAAHLYRRAIESGRASGAGSRDLAAAWEALGEALRQAGERQVAGDAFATARRLFEGSPVDQARLMYRQAVGAERSGGGLAAVRWAMRGLRVLEGRDDAEARRWRARLLADLAGFRQRQGRWPDAETFCLQAIVEAEAVGELRAMARAWYVLDYVLVESGRPEQATHSPRALEIYAELGDPEQESGVLNNLGMFAYWRGDWDEAIDWYRRQAAASERSGNPANVAYTDCNVGEILSDQGHFAAATEHLRRARRVWRSTGDAPGVAFANLQLGRTAVRQGDYEDGVSLLTAAARELRRFRLDGYADFGDALVAEAEAFGGDATRALEISEALLETADRDEPLLRRLRGIALARLGRADTAIEELESALAACEARAAHYERAATLDAMDAIGRLDPSRARERDAILQRLDVTVLPRPALEAAPATEGRSGSGYRDHGSSERPAEMLA